LGAVQIARGKPLMFNFAIGGIEELVVGDPGNPEGKDVFG
jgi:hypothetical protein